MNDNFSIYSKITLDLSEYKKSIAELQRSTSNIEGSLTDMSKNVNNSFKQIAKSIGIAFAVKEVVRFGKYAVRSAEEAESQFRKLAQTVKVTGAETWTTTQYLAQMSEQLSNQTNYSVTEIQEMQTVLLGFKNITGEAFDSASNAILDMAEVMGMDLKSATQAVGKALDDPIKGMGALSRQGFVFSEQEKENLKLLIETGNQLEAQKIILNELNTTYGNASREGQRAFSELKNATQNLTEDLGKLLLPTLEKIAKKFADIFTDFHNLINEGANYEAKEQTRKDVLSGRSRNAQDVKSSKEYQTGISEALYTDYMDTLKYFNLIQIEYNKRSKEQRAVISEMGKLYGEEVHHYEAQGLEYVEAVKAVMQDKKEAWEKSLTDLKFIEDLETQIVTQSEKDRREQLAKEREQSLSDIKSAFMQQKEVIEDELDLKVRTGEINDEVTLTQERLNKVREAFYKAVKDSNGELAEDADLMKIIADVTRDYNLACLNAGKAVESLANKDKKATKQIGKDWKDSQFKKAFLEFSEEIEADAKDWTDVYTTTFQAIRQGFGDAFSAMGQALVEGENGWQNWGAVALDTLSQVLSALGAQLSAMAVEKALHYSFGEAALATAGAAAAFTASGALKGVANQMKTVANDSAETLKTFKQIKEAIDNINKSMTSFTSYISGNRQLNEIVEEQATKLDKARQADEAVAEQREASYKLWKQYEEEYKKIANTRIKDDDSFLAYKNMISGFMYAYKSTYEELEGYNKNYQEAFKKYNYSLAQLEESAQKALTTIKDSNKGLDFDIAETMSILQKATNSVTDVYVLKENIRNSFKQLELDVLNDISTVGLTFAESIYNSLNEGLGSNDLMKDIKKTLRSQMIKLSVYTTEVTDKLTWFSRKAMDALTNHNEAQLKDMKWQMENLFKELQKEVKEIDAFFDDVFGNIEDNIDGVIDSVEDMASTIGDELSSALEEGLEQGDFIETMKKYLRKMVIQSVVYTQSLKAEIEAIGKAISEGIANGFSETGLHEIKRDLSYIFEQANSAIGKIDSVLNSVFDVSGYATGTQNATAGLHLVGEAGAELVRFKGGEQVYNAQDTQKILSGAGGQTFNYTFNNLQDTSAYAMMKQLKAYDRQMAIDGIL